MEKIGKKRSWCLSKFDPWREMRLRDREKDFGQRREKVTIVGGGCDKPALPIWFRDLSLFQRDITHSVGFLYLFFLLLIFFNKLYLVARKGRNINNGVTILLINLLVLNLILFSLFFFFMFLVFSLRIEVKSYIACIFVNCL